MRTNRANRADVVIHRCYIVVVPSSEGWKRPAQLTANSPRSIVECRETIAKVNPHGRLWPKVGILDLDQAKVVEIFAYNEEGI